MRSRTPGESLADDSAVLEADHFLAGNVGPDEDLAEEREAMKKNPKVFGAFVGEVMKRTRGRADPKQVSATLRKLLDEYHVSYTTR